MCVPFIVCWFGCVGVISIIRCLLLVCIDCSLFVYCWCLSVVCSQLFLVPCIDC